MQSSQRYQHFGVFAVDVHSRTVHVEIAKGHIREPVHVVKRAEHPLVGDLCGPVQGAIVVGMMRFGSGEDFGHAVDRGRRGGDDFLDPRLNARLEHVQRAVDQHLHALAGLLGALGDADGGLVKHAVDAVEIRPDAREAANVLFDQLDPAASERRLDVPACSAGQIVHEQDADGRLLGQQPVCQGGPDQSASAGDQNCLAGKIHDRFTGAFGRPLP